jgi:hypothetical protein
MPDGTSTGKLAVVAFEALEEGRRYGPFRFHADRELCDALRGAPGEAPRPGETAPPGLFTVIFLRAFAAAMGGIPPGGVALKLAIDFRAEVARPADLEATVRIGAKEVKRGRPRATIELSVAEAGSRVAAVEGSMTIAWATVAEQEASL